MTTAHSQRTILVVEDDPTMQDLLHIFLEDSGCLILTANRGRDAIELANATNPDIVTLDLGLPDMDGVEVLRQIQGSSNHPGPFVIVVTARQFKPQPGEHVGAVLRKPFDAAELERMVQDALAAASARPARLA